MTISRMEAQSPASADATVSQDWGKRYTEKSHKTWAKLLSALRPLSNKTSCTKLLHGQEVIRLDSSRIPKFEELSSRLSTSTNWEIIGTNGFLPNEIFFTHLANKRFPMACDIRSLDGSDFQEFPDLFHDIYGHTPLLIYPEVSDLLQSSAVGILKAIKLGRHDLVKKIAAAYWFTIEVGLVREKGAIRVYGAAIASSPKEIMFATQDTAPNLIRFNLDRVMRSQYNMLELQQTYFVLDDIDELQNLAKQDFFERALQLENLPTLAQGEICPSDEVIRFGKSHQQIFF